MRLYFAAAATVAFVAIYSGASAGPAAAASARSTAVSRRPFAIGSGIRTATWSATATRLLSKHRKRPRGRPAALVCAGVLQDHFRFWR